MDSERANRSGSVTRGMRGLRAWTVVLLIAASGLAIGMLSPNAAAAVKYTNSNGYQGNYVIYMSTGITGNPYVIPTVYSHVAQSASGSNYNVGNAINLTVGERQSTPSGDLVFDEFYTASSNRLQIDIPIAGAAGGQMYHSIGGLYYQIWKQKLSLSVSNSPSSSDPALQVITVYNSGLNVTGPKLTGTTRSQALWNLLLDGLSFLPTVGYVVGAYQTMDDYQALSGVDSFVIQNTGNNQVYEWFDVKGGAYTPGTSHGQNVFGGQMYVTIYLSVNDFMTPYLLFNIGAANQVAVTCLDCPVTTAPGASASLSVYAYPAVTVRGTVYARGSPVANQVIDFTAVGTGNVYETKTDANGNYRWFAKPNTAYTLTSTYSTTFGLATGTTSFTTPNSATTQTVNLALPVSFVYGYVTNSYGSPIWGADVQVTSPLGPIFHATTSSTGYWSFTAKDLGTYSLFASAYGYSPRSGSVSVGAFNRTYQAATFTLGPYIPPPPPPPPPTCPKKPCPI